MAFSKKTWKDRVSQYINRRLLTDSDGNTQQVTVTRDEGSVTEAGDAFSAANMNDLENRIEAAIPVKIQDLDNVTLTTSDNNKLLGSFVENGEVVVRAVEQLHIETGKKQASSTQAVRVTFDKAYTTPPHVVIVPYNSTSPREYIRSCTVTAITTTYFEFVEQAISKQLNSFLNGTDDCEWIAYGV